MCAFVGVVFVCASARACMCVKERESEWEREREWVRERVRKTPRLIEYAKSDRDKSTEIHTDREINVFNEFNCISRWTERNRLKN